MAFSRFHLSSYLTHNPTEEEKAALLKAAKDQTEFWLDEFKFDDEQKQQTKIFTGKVRRNRHEKELFGVYALIPLRENQGFPAIWDAPLNSLGEDVTLEQQ